jgi:2-dehydro-3-deoxy-D-arabinonate dehydratase
MDRLTRHVEGAGTRLDNLLALPPIELHQEGRASGVTYQRSREAREAESKSADVYAEVYSAERPELFLKAPGWRVRAHGDPVRIRPGDRARTARCDARSRDRITVTRNGEEAFAGTVRTAQMKRTFEELAAYLGRELSFPSGAFLMTGTGIVPPDVTCCFRACAISSGAARRGWR